MLTWSVFWQICIFDQVWFDQLFWLQLELTLNSPFDYTKLNLRQSPVHRRLFISLRPSYCLFHNLTSREVLVYSLSCDLFETDTLNSPCDHTNLNLQHLLRLDKFELKMKIYWSKFSKTWGFRKNSIPFWHKSFFRKIGTVFL